MTALFATTGASGAPVGTATIAANVFTITAHGLIDGQTVVTSSPTGAAVGVLVPGAPYYVASATANTFELRPSPGAPVMTVASGGVSVDAAEAVYDPQGMRQSLGGLYYKARPSTPSVGRFGARWGVLQNGGTVEASVSGMTVTVENLNCVIVTAGSTTRGPYLCAIPTAQHTLSAADPTNPRIDVLVAEVLDNAADASGDLIPGRTRIITGTPAGVPVAPTVADGLLELAQFSIPAGSSSATITFTAPYTVAAGGILPVRDTAGLPASIRREGMYADQADVDALMRFNGAGSWETIASAKGYQYWQTVSFTSSGSFTKASYPGLRAVRIRCQGGGGAGGGAAVTGAGSASSGGGGQGGVYAEAWILASALSASETVTRGAGGTGVSGGTGNNGGTSSFGAHCSASGGAGGQTNSSTSTWNTPISATPVITGTGDLIIPGEPGTFGLTNGTADFALSGAGGSSVWGIGGRPVQSATGAAGFAGDGYGGGGGGGGNSNSQAGTVAGGAGTAGRILVDLYV